VLPCQPGDANDVRQSSTKRRTRGLSAARRAKLFEATVDVPVPQRLRRGRNGSLRPLETLNVAARSGGQAHLWIWRSICRFCHGYLTRYRVPALTVKWGSKGYAFQGSQMTSRGRARSDAAIRYEKLGRKKKKWGQEFGVRERADKSN